MASSSSSAGRSAQREHDRRRRLDDERRRKTLVARVVVTVLTPVVVLLAVRFGAAALEAAIERQTGRSIDADQRPLVSDGQVAVIALLLAAGATLTVVQRLWLRPATTAAWAKGAEGSAGPLASSTGSPPTIGCCTTSGCPGRERTSITS
jgi:hypothetical protein